MSQAAETLGRGGGKGGTIRIRLCTTYRWRKWLILRSPNSGSKRLV